MCKSYIYLNHIRFTIPNSHCLKDLSISFENKCYGLVGDNGVGKSTLLKLLAGELTLEQGTIQRSGEVVYLPQYYSAKEKTIAELLGIKTKLQALDRIQQGFVQEEDYECLANDWDLLARVEEVFDYLDIADLKFERLVSSLSGGQLTKCLLARIMLTKADFLLLDEPTNNLDRTTRALFYDWVATQTIGLLIVSHDRNLLNRADEIIELTTKGMAIFGGNYDFYERQKYLEQQALDQQLSDAQRQIKSIRNSIQDTREKHERRAKKGRNLRKEGRVDKLTANSMKGRSEKSQSRNTTLSEKMIQAANDQLAFIQDKILIKETIHAQLPATIVPQGKIVLEIKQLGFGYNAQLPIIDRFNLTIMGPERVAILGENGSGKSTLIKLIRGEYEATVGEIKLGVTRVCYLDQEVSFLVPSLSLLANFQKINPDASLNEAHMALAAFNFRNKEAERKVNALSGGEKIRAALAVTLLGKIPPQLIILDEPTNHLDLRSIEAVEQALRLYQGAMIVISHDERFLENIGITREVTLGK